MIETVWCVFQKLPAERCPTLSAVCASRAAADALVRVSEAESRARGEPATEWTVGRWDVLDGEVGEIEEIQRISRVLDPQRDGVLPSMTSEIFDAAPADEEREG